MAEIGKLEITVLDITPLKIADYAINLACEAVQTAAMLMKYEMSLNPATEREGE